jgi:hypothetical protein
MKAAVEIPVIVLLSSWINFASLMSQVDENFAEESYVVEVFCSSRKMPGTFKFIPASASDPSPEEGT